MKHITTKNCAIAVAIALGFSVVPGAQAADKGCSDASLTGTFAYTTTGSILAPPALAGPFASVGTQTFDGIGGTTAAATVSQNGNIVVHGSAQLVQGLIANDLVDELHLMVFPIVLGAGKRLFGDTRVTKPLSLVDTRQAGETVILTFRKQ